MAACVMAQYGHHYEQPEERKFVSLPALKLKLDLDKLTFRLPNLMSLFHTEREQPHYPPPY